MVVCFVGSDDYQKQSGARALIDKLVPPEERDFGLEIINATCEKAEEVLSVLDRAREALYTESFFGSGKVVWLREANFLAGAKGRATEALAAKEAAEAFLELLQRSPLPEGHTLIVSSTGWNRSTRFAKWAEKVGRIVECGGEVKSGNRLQVALERLKGFLPKCGNLVMSAAVQQAFAQRVGADSWTIFSELSKLRTYLGRDGATVTLGDLEAITCMTADVEPFGISNALSARSAKQVAKAVEELSSDKNAAFPTVAMVLNLLNELCALRDALDRRWIEGGRWTIPAERVPQKLRSLQGWILGKKLEAARNYTLQELRAARHYAVEMRFKLVDTSSQDPWTIVEPVLLRIAKRGAR